MDTKTKYTTAGWNIVELKQPNINHFIAIKEGKQPHFILQTVYNDKKSQERALLSREDFINNAETNKATPVLAFINAAEKKIILKNYASDSIILLRK